MSHTNEDQVTAGVHALLDAIKIEDLPIKTLTRNALQNVGIKTFGDLRKKSEFELKRIPMFGRKAHEDVLMIFRAIEDAGRRR
jgi:DNA-directed RNA polymerase alpha subunit